jgi:hypothetical protein
MDVLATKEQINKSASAFTHDELLNAFSGSLVPSQPHERAAKKKKKSPL